MWKVIGNMLNIHKRKCWDDVEAYVTGTLIIYVVRNLEYRDSIPGMKHEHLFLCCVNTGSGTHPGLFCPVYTKVTIALE